MNKQDIAIVVLLVALLFGWMHFQNKSNAERMRAWQEEQEAIAATNQVDRAVLSADVQNGVAFEAASGETNLVVASTQAGTHAGQVVAASEKFEEETGVPEKTMILSDGEVSIVVSSKGGTISSATLAGYRQTVEKESGDIRFDYTQEPMLALEGVKGLGVYSDYEFAGHTSTSVVMRAKAASGVEMVREIMLLPDYKIKVRDSIQNTGKETVAVPEYSIGIGSVVNPERGATSLLSVDSLSAVLDRRGRFGKVVHWSGKNSLSSLFTHGRGGGCSGAPDAAQFAPTATQRYNDPQKWVAFKSRFFAVVFQSDTLHGGPTTGYELTAGRSLESGPLHIERVSGKFFFPGAVLAEGQEICNEHSIYVGPKKHSVIRKFGPQSAEIMEFGFWKFLCVILLPLLNGLYMIFRNYGVAIIVLTILVRLIFWPLTRKSNEGMRRMGEMQPKIKALQEQFKGDPQKLQQETMKFYRENKINPMASCLPMLIQIPVFIALFVVLRSATELRFASFLWIADLSEPENLLKGVIPYVPAINLLPFLMAGTMFLQSKLTPSMGDPNQQKMMMWMMPLMMFFMFYSMPSALLLYWSVSQILAIVQLVWQRKKRTPAGSSVGSDGVIEGEVVTRQQRRRAARQ